ncbi:MerR family transcriptional regulator [Nocardioides sp. OK12]|uniref:DNA-binding transcriptional MerR regulator n=1 Tax=Nocardioides marinisabuli TaxID=419476 RepID=A0A7Y9JP52_9ACTN|nr:MULTISPECIES: MerR family transcriptional regulator [Nocardioides]NYD56602.1 DNA-binding transcriptional MerR regulator [Nocardioides marinisabuli]GHJ59354.1 MerR family transcriptional regulator [Nocardioides sp. OK12]
MAAHMQIGEVAALTGLSLRTLRYYEEVGLVAPSARSAGGFRLYTALDVDRFELIKRMKPLDFSLEDMRGLLGVVDALDADPDEDERARLLGELESLRTAAEQRVDALRTRLAWAEEFAAGLDERVRAHRER